MVQPRKEGSVPEDFVDERIRAFLRRQMNGQTERARVRLDLPLDRAGVRGFHEAWTAAGDDVDPHPRQLEGELLHFLVDRIAAADARAAEDGDAVVLDPLGLDVIEVVDRRPEAVD